MMMKNKYLLALGALATCTSLFMAPTQAQPALTMEPILVASNQTPETTSPQRAHSTLPDRSEWISLKEAFDAIEKAGYRDIRSIRSSRHHGYVARAVDADQKTVKLQINPKDGSVQLLQESSKKHSKHKHRKSHDS